MVSKTFFQIALFVLGASLTSAAPLEERTTATNIVCAKTATTIVEHDKNVALLSICGGISGTIQKCGGSPTSTTGVSGTAKFTINPTISGATINVSKGRWEQCIKSAEAVCPTSSGGYSATCPLGASTGDLDFTLGNP